MVHRISDIRPTQPLIATTHLESVRKNGQQRERQLKTIDTILRSLLKEARADGDGQRAAAVLAGDFNFDVSWPENQVMEDHFVDLWLSNEPGFTEDTQRNLMRLEATQKPKQVRFDRVVSLAMRPDSEDQNSIEVMKATSMSLLGTEERDGLWPSDHFGVVADLWLME